MDLAILSIPTYIIQFISIQFIDQLRALKGQQENCTKMNKKHIDASVKKRPQTLLVPSEEICKRVLCNKHI